MPTYRGPKSQCFVKVTDTADAFLVYVNVSNAKRGMMVFFVVYSPKMECV